MAMRKPVFSLLLSLLFVLLLSFSSGGTLKMVNADEFTWCVPKPSLDEKTLLNNINFACSQVDCSRMEPGEPCFSPNTTINHAFIAMNLYFQRSGRKLEACDFDKSSLIAITDPTPYGSEFCGYTYE